MTGATGTDLTINNVNFACFTACCHIETDQGLVAVEHLSSGMLIRTLDNGFKPVCAVLSRVVSGLDQFAPIVIRKGALGNVRELTVSPAHRMLINDWRAELMFGLDEALASAKSLCNGDTIYRQSLEEVEYFHIILDQHEIIFAEGSHTESYHLDNDTMFDDEVAVELVALFPELMNFSTTTARPVLSGYEVTALVATAA